MNIKETQMKLSQIISLKDIILLDIEGTITSIDFVKDVLFAIARESIQSYLSTHFEKQSTKTLIEEFRKQIKIDSQNGVKGAETLPEDGCSKSEMLSSLVENIYAMMDADRKIGPLKTLQGRIWRESYADGTIKGHVYEDVVPALKLWKKQGKQICIYSSGSIEAQKLLLQHSTQGDLLEFFTSHYDTSVGLKVEAESYEKIAKSLDVDPQSIIFITDIALEATAASTAGMDVILSVRPGNKPLSKEIRDKFPVITSFQDCLDTEEQINLKRSKRKSSDTSQPPTSPIKLLKKDEGTD